MKKFNQKFHRIMALICAAVMLVTSVQLSPTLFARADGETASLAPIGVAFGSEEKVTDVKNNYGVAVNGGFTSTTTFEIDEETGKSYMRLKGDPISGQVTSLKMQYFDFLRQSGQTSVRLEDYPYMKISYRYDRENPNTNWQTMQVYAYDSAGTALYNVETGTDDLFYDTDDAWREMILNFGAKSYAIYDQQGGKLESHTMPYGLGTVKGTWSGEATSFRLDLVLGGTSLSTYDIEYIALFATEEEALAYPNTPAKLELQEELESAEFTATFAEASTVALAEQIAGAQIQDIIDAQETTSGSNATYTMSNSKLYFNSTGGAFTSDVAVTMPGQITFHFALNMTITGRKSPITVIFDDEETVQGVKNFSGGDGFKATRSFEVDAENGKKFLRFTNTPKDDNSIGLDMQYWDFVSQSGQASVKLENYPYMKISYRYVRPTGTAWDTMQFYAYDSTGTRIYNVETGTNDLYYNENHAWKEMILNFSAGSFTIYDKAGDFKESHTFMWSQGSVNGSWSGEATSIRLDPVNGSRSLSTYDIEYIALFATEVEALAYSSSMDSDVDALEGADFSCKGTKVSTAEAAYNELKAQIDALGLQNAYTLEEATFTAASSTVDGSYVATVVLDPANKVQVTMTIVAPKEPLRVVFYSQEKVEKAGVDGATKSFVDETSTGGKKYMHLDMNEGSNWIRYYSFATQTDVGYVDFDVYKYVKISYRRIVPNKDHAGWEVSDIVCVPQNNATEEWYDIQSNKEDTGWITKIFDASKLASNRWSGQGDVYLDFSNGGTFHRIVDVEYVAFFATKEEAEAYTCTIENGATYAKKYDEIKGYRVPSFTAPQADEDGFVFGGWYHDEELTQPLATTDLEGPAYAKFVDKDVLSVKTQAGLNEEKELPDDKTTLRFVTTVDNRMYSRVGFKIAMQKGDTYTAAFDTYNPEDPKADVVYQKLYAIGSNQETIEYEPTVFSDSSSRFKAWNLNNISESLYDVNFRARAYWVTMDGTMVEGEISVRSVNGSKEVK